MHRAALGFAINRDSSGAYTVAALDPDSGAGHSGLMDGDILESLNGEDVPRAPDRWLRDHQPEDRITARVRRATQELEIAFPLGRTSDANYQVNELPNPTERQRRIRDGILHGTTTPLR